MPFNLLQGNCYVWSLTPGTKLPDGEEGSMPTQLRPKSRLLAHKRYGLKCKFSPDAKYDTGISYFLQYDLNLFDFIAQVFGYNVGRSDCEIMENRRLYSSFNIAN